MRQPAQPLWRFGPVLPELRRRWFLQALMAGGLIGWLARADARGAASRSRGAARQQVAATPQAPSAMPQALPILVDHLIPADELTPAASAVGVPPAIWREAQADAELRTFLEGGCAWLDRYGNGFAALTEDEREALCVWMSQADWSTPQRRFFHWVRERAFTLYYGQPAAWRGLPFERPPQPIGFSDQRGL